MAVKKLAMMDVVCHRDDLDGVVKELVLTGKCEFIDAFQEIDEGEFNIGISLDHADEILGMEDIVRMKGREGLAPLSGLLDRILTTIDYKPKLQTCSMEKAVKFIVLKDRIEAMCNEFSDLTEEIRITEQAIDKLHELTYFENLVKYNIPIGELVELHHFTMKLGYINRDRAKRISMNYENIKAIVLHLGGNGEEELYMVLSPKNLDQEMERILRSISFEELPINKGYLGTPAEIMKKVSRDLRTYEGQLSELKDQLAKETIDRRHEMDEYYSKLQLEKQLDQIRKKMAVTRNFAYMSVWIPEDDKPAFEAMLTKHQELSVFFKKADEVSPRIEVPTKLENHPFFQPFEMLVNMYGVPSYREIDPTVFFGIAYIFIFGAMFGDLGQGAVIMLAGIFLQKRMGNDFGAILSRIGIGSMVFGLVYDSLFGYEDVISKFLPLPFYIRPIENINLVLILAVGAGVLLLLVSYSYSIVNKLKVGDYEEGLLGKNGINGVILFLMILLAAYGMFFGGEDFPLAIPVGIIMLNVILLIVKQPLANKIMGKERLYAEAKSEYFVESGFNIFEIFLSLLSNCISFVRVGAFALNHVGLFIAFHTLATMIGGTGGNVAMFFLGNIVILGLEGLIVFIQGLRLFYYELFSKYYSGEGILFVPDEI